MNDEDKPKEQLIQELARLRQRITELEVSETEYKRAKEELKKVSEFSEGLLDRMADGLSVLDENGIHIDVNLAFCNMTAFPREELIGVGPPHPYWPPEEYGKIEEAFDKTLQGDFEDIELTFMRKDGQRFPVIVSPSCTKDKQGNVTSYFATVKDITERKQMEEEIKRTQSSLAEAQHIAHIGSWDWQIKTNFLHWSDEMHRIFGIDQQQFSATYEAFLNCVHPDDREFVKKSVHNALYENKSYDLEYRIILPNGSKRNIQARGRVTFDNRGEPVRMIGTVNDITERKQIEEVLKTSEKKYRELADLLPQTVFELDKSGNFTFANFYGFQSSGYTPEDIKKGLNALQLFIPEDRVRVKKNIRIVLGGRKSNANEYTALRKDGSTYPVIVYSAPVFYEGKPAGLRGVVLDITERKHIENELQKSREQLRSLAAHLQSVREEERTDIARGVHDELGQALTALKMDLSWLGKRLPKKPESLLEKTKVMSGLLDSAIQTVKKISTELRPGILDDFGLIAAIEWQAEEFHKRSGIKCTVSSVTEPHLDRELNTALFRIFQETLTNVARHTSATRVTVNLKVQDGKMIMRTRDNGKGITPEQLSSSSSFGIIGMRERVRALQGEITIRGIPGKGTTVAVTIPLVKNGEAQ
jgi:PAS domain S-box-containing protein